ncbi:MAG: NAD(P)-dependent glycerol-1-phosphate dehydrogenase [Desulfurococcales archaeon]|nr:NAD(P)-dependent glycerol-1-phosphate dehydrogenase [Desulfurococcales archaeon]
MSKDPHVIDLPKKVIIGNKVLERLPEIIREMGDYRRIHVVTGPHVKRIAGEVVLEGLSRQGIDFEVSIINSPTLQEAEAVLDEVRAFRPELVVGLGGGKAVDAGKYVAAKMKIPFVSAPTSASHDGIASPFVSLLGGGRVTSEKAMPPLAIVADVGVISTAPKRLLRAGAGDLIGKFTAVLDWRLAHRLKGEYYGAYAASLSLLSAKHVLAASEVIGGGSSEAVRIVIEGLVSSSVAMCIAGSTRPASGSEHLFSHALDIVAHYPALHGEEVAVGSIMMAYLHGKNWKRLRRAAEAIGLPTTAKELGVKDTDIIEALVMAHKIRPERYTILGESGLTYEAAERLAQKTGVIE